MSTVTVKLSSALVVNGQVQRAGQVVELDDYLARNVVQRGKGEILGGQDHQADQGEPADLGDDGQEAVQEVADQEPVDLSRMNKAQLLDIAEQMGLDVSDDMTKAEITKAIEGAAE